MKEESIAQKQDRQKNPKTTDGTPRLQRQLLRSEETYKLNEIHTCDDVT